MSAVHDNADSSDHAGLPVEFRFEEHTVRTINNGEEIWFVAADVCDALEIKNSRDAAARLDDDEKGVALIDTLGGPQEQNTVNEFGLYRLILRSDKPKAKAFQRWVIHEVLPSIRKTGRYEAGLRAEDETNAADAQRARQYLHKVYADGLLNPEDLLVALFGETIPFTGDKKFRFLAVPACEALGLQNPTAAIGLLPESEQDTVDIETPEGARKMRAITEAGLYFLAFTRRRQTYPDTHVFAQFIALLDVLWLKLRTQDSSFANNPLAIAFDATIRSAFELAMQSSDLPISRCRSKSARGSVAPLGL